MTLSRIASRLGISVTTVSRALGGYPEVAAETRARVLAEVARTDYRANRAAVMLRQGRSGAVGLVLPTAPGQFQDAFFLAVLAALGPLLARAGLDMLVTAAAPGAEEMRAYRHLVEGRRVDGMVVARTRVRDNRIAYLLDRGLPFVAHGRTRERRAHAWVDTDGAAAFRAATAGLVALGHRRIGLVNADPAYAFAQDRAAGWRAALRDAGLPPGPAVAGEPTEENGHRLAAALLDGAAPPTALLCGTDRLAVGALHAAAARGLRAGRDLSVIGHDDLPVAGYVDPPLTTLAPPLAAQAARIVEMLLHLIGGGSPLGLHALFPATLVARASHGPAPAAAPHPIAKETAHAAIPAPLA